MVVKINTMFGWCGGARKTNPSHRAKSRMAFFKQDWGHGLGGNEVLLFQLVSLFILRYIVLTPLYNDDTSLFFRGFVLCSPV